MRTFIAVELPRRLQNDLSNQTASLQQKLGYRAVRWVSAHNIHLTLKFLGEIQSSQIDQLKQILLQETRQATPFALEIGGFGAFPDAKRPRILWIGIQAPAVLGSLQRGLNSALQRIGFPPEDKPFSPHLTIGRVSPQATPAEIQALRAALEGPAIGLIGTVNVDALHLFKSDLLPAGPVYTPLYSAKFGA